MAYQLPVGNATYDEEAGGPVVTALRGLNALRKAEQENKYYGPKAESEMAHQNALTRTLDTLTPLQAQELALKNAFYNRDTESQIASREALTKKAIEETKYLGSNSIIGNILKKAEADKINALMPLTIAQGQYPGLSSTGTPKDLAFEQYYRDKENQQRQGVAPSIGDIGGEEQRGLPQMNGARMPMQNAISGLGNENISLDSITNALSGLNANKLPTQNQLLTQGNPESNSQRIARALKQDESFKKARTEKLEKENAGINFLKGTTDEKNYQVSQAVGFGYDRSDAQKQLIEGKSLQDLAKEKGIDANPKEWPEPEYPTTKEIQNEIRKGYANEAAMTVLGSWSADAIAPYQGLGGKQKLWLDYSQGIAGTRNTSKEREELYAGQIAGTENVISQVQSITGRVTQQGIDRVKNAAMADLQRPWYLTPEEFKVAQKEILLPKIEEAINARIEALKTGKPYKSKEKKNSKSNLYTRAEIEHTAKQSGKSIEQVISDMDKAGVPHE